MKNNIKGLKKAVSETRNNSNAVRIYFNKEENTVWAISEASLNTWEEYQDVNIINVYSIGNANDHKLTMKELENLCKNA